MSLQSATSDYDILCSDFRWNIPARFNIAQAICSRHARTTPDAPALVFAETGRSVRTFSYSEMETLSARLANALAALGVGPGSIVAVNLPQGAEVILALTAATRLGAIFLPLAALFGPDALRYRLADSGASVLITSDEGFERCRSALADLPGLRHTLVVSQRPRSHDRDFWRLLERGAPDHACRDTAAEDPGLMLYTSGTTGQPKGVLHAHRMILASTASMSFAHDRFPQAGDRLWTPADWAWAGGFNALLTTLVHGKAIVATRPTKFDPEQALDLMSRHEVRNTFIPPTALRMMRALPADQIEQRCRLRSLMSGGEALGSDMIAWGRETFGVTISEGFGLSEASPMSKLKSSARALRTAQLSVTGRSSTPPGQSARCG